MIDDICVKHVQANIICKGRETKYNIDNMHNSAYCKEHYQLGTGSCYGRCCEECMDTPMYYLEESDADVDRMQNEEATCDNCEAENCGACEDYSEWVHD